MIVDSASGEVLPPDEVLVEGLRDGDEYAFGVVFAAWSAGMARVARSFVSSAASAEDVVQDTWLAVIGGIVAFEGRSALKSWVYAILVNTARARGVKESRLVSLDGVLAEERAPSVDSERLRGPRDPYPGNWASGRAPSGWTLPEDRVLRGEMRTLLAEALWALPERQRLVITLRDVEGLSSDEAADALGMTAGNLRIVLHRARATLRGVLERYFADQPAGQEARP